MFESFGPIEFVGVLALGLFIFWLIKLSIWLIKLSLRPSKDRHPHRHDPEQGTTPKARKGVSIFISYRRGDSSDITGRIYDILAQRFGKEVLFRDVDSIPLGVDFRKHLTESVGQCHLLLAIIGKGWLNEGKEDRARLENPRDYVRIEIEAAFQRDIPIIPVLVQGAALPAEDHLPERIKPLAYHNSISIRPDPDFHHDMARLISGILVHVHAGPASPDPVAEVSF